jgi:hypothetical protein
MKFRWWLTSSLIVGSFLISVPSLAQDAAKTGDQTKQETTQIFLEPEFFIRKHLIASPKPEYPQATQEAGIQGELVVFVCFDQKDGNLVEAKPLVSPDESLSTAVVGALKDWRIKPYLPYNREAHNWSELRFVFSLKDGKAEVSDAPETEQRTVSQEFTQEHCRRLKDQEQCRPLKEKE